MKRFIIPIIALFFILNACTKTNNAGGDKNTVQLTEAEKISAIDTLAAKLDAQWKPGPNLRKAYFNERDSVEFLLVNNEPERISSIFTTDTTVIWVTLHQINNDIKLVRYREWSATPKQRVKEAISYLENGKIFFSKERFKYLEEGEPWASFRFATFVENARTPEEMTAEYMPFWDATKKAIDLKLAPEK